ncbi:hypothetical protein, partial [Sansalvadorimonas verongulae]|uniref:hypothetical protein n=1 Tax=Sansalvadorimonas verongulae TaxID=2172824 RepID=UPI0018AD1344
GGNQTLGICWRYTGLMEKAKEFSEHYCQHRPDEEALRKRLFVISHEYSDLIKKTFADYLYQTAHVNGGGITVCWFDALAGTEMNQVGHHVPQSTTELNTLMTEVTSFNKWDIHGR